MTSRIRFGACVFAEATRICHVSSTGAWSTSTSRTLLRDEEDADAAGSDVSHT